jgi:hypothetical protein
MPTANRVPDARYINLLRKGPERDPRLAYFSERNGKRVIYLRIITTLEFFEHHFTKSGHEDLIVARQYPDHIAIVHLHAREASAAEPLRSSRCIESAQTHRARAYSLLTRASDTTLRLSAIYRHLAALACAALPSTALGYCRGPGPNLR